MYNEDDQNYNMHVCRHEYITKMSKIKICMYAGINQNMHACVHKYV